MKQKRGRLIFFSSICGLCIALVFAAGAASIGLLLTIANTGEGQSLTALGFTVYRNDELNPMDGYEPGTAVVVQNVAHDSLKRGDLVVCRDLDINNQYYPVTRIFSSFEEDAPLTLTVETFGNNEIQTVNRDDVVGKCVFSSMLLGRVLALFQHADRGFPFMVLVIGCCAVIFLLCLLFYLILSHRARKSERGLLPEEEQHGLSILLEQEDVPLVTEVPHPLPENKQASEANLTEAVAPEGGPDSGPLFNAPAQSALMPDEPLFQHETLSASPEEEPQPLTVLQERNI